MQLLTFLKMCVDQLKGDSSEEHECTIDCFCKELKMSVTSFINLKYCSMY